MKNKYLVVCFLSITSTGAMAASNAFEGLYGQLGFGYATASSSFTGGVRASDSTPYTISSENSKNIAGTVTAGYNFAVTNTFMLGVGAESEYSPFSSSKGSLTQSPSSILSTTGQFEKKNSYNFFVSPGLVIDRDKLTYAKVGFNKTTARIDTIDLNYKGYSLGVGYKQLVNKNIYGFGEINYAKYDTQSDRAGFTGTHSPDATNFLIGAGYQF